MIADTSRFQLYQMIETAWGVVPTTALKELRNTGESLKGKFGTTKSGEISSDRQISDLILIDASAEGGFNYEMSYGSFDDLLEGALYNSWSAPVTITALTISAAATDDSFNDSGSGFPVVVPGQWIKVAGFTTAANNGFFRVVSRTTAKIVIEGALVDEAAGASVTIKSGGMLRNGTTTKSFVLEKKFADITQFLSYTGMMVGDYSLDFEAGAVLKGAFGFQGKSVTPAQATVGTGAAVAASTTGIMNAVNNILGIRRGATAWTAKISKLGLALKNNLRAQKAVGSLGAVGVGSGRCEVTGSLSVYFEDASFYTDYVQNNAFLLSFRAQDNAGNAYVFTLPKVKLTDANIVAGGPDADVMVEGSYQALKDPTTLITVQIDRFPIA